MTSKPAATPRVRHFRTFSALSYPVKPQQPIDVSEAQELSTYYEARYDDKERLIEFVKHVRADDDSGKKWAVMFTEAYDYFASGSLKKRTLKIPGQPDQVWEFTDHQKSWSSYFNEFCTRWFGRQSDPEQREPTRLSLLVHEQFTDLEIAIFEASAGAVCDNQWALEMTVRALAEVRAIIQGIEADSAPKICALSQGQQNVLKPEGFDEPAPNLFSIVQEWRENRSRSNELDVMAILPKKDFDASAKNWAADENISTIIVAPVRAVDGPELTVVMTLFLLTAIQLDDDMVCIANSIFRRFVQLIQNIIQTARFQESFKEESSGKDS